MKLVSNKHLAPPKQQADAAISQNNPVSTTLYEVLPTTRNVRVISISASITWAVTQPTPLEVVMTIDGQSVVFIVANPVSASPYEAANQFQQAETAQGLLSGIYYSAYRSFLREGRSVRVQVRVTWAVTQPTPLVCRVKWAKW